MQRRKAGARLRRLVLLALLAILAGVVLQAQSPSLTFLGPLAPREAASRADAGAPQYPYTALNPYGVNTFLEREVEDWKREKTLQMMADAGIGWMKQLFPWTEIEPKRGRYWDDKYNQDSWDKYDRIVALAEKYGVHIIARLDNVPDWVRADGSNPQTPPTDVEDYANFVATFVQHYRGRVQYIQIWNEPNLKAEWGGRLDPAGYTRLLCRAYARAKEVDPNVVILSAPLAQTLEQGDRGLDELAYLQQLYDAGMGPCYDILFANGYGFDQPPEAPPAPDRLNYRRVELLREVMVRNGEGAKPIWLNEYGWNAAPASLPRGDLYWGRVTEDAQARYTVDGIRYGRQNWPWLGVINIWYFRQVGDIPATRDDYYFRMVDVEFSEGLVYRELKKEIAAQRVAAPGRYGPLDPAISSSGRWSTLSEGQTSALALRSERPGDQLTVRFRGNGLALLAEHGPTAGRLSVTVDNSTAGLEGLPRDERGRRYVDLRAETKELALAPVVANLDSFATPREHTAVLTVLPSDERQTTTEVVVRGIEVTETPASRPWAILLAAVVVLLLGGAVLLIRAIGQLRGGADG